MKEVLYSNTLIRGKLESQQTTKMFCLKEECLLFYCKEGHGTLIYGHHKINVKKHQLFLLQQSYSTIIPNETMTIVQVLIPSHRIVIDQALISLFIQDHPILLHTLALLEMEVDGLYAHDVCFSSLIQVLFVQINRILNTSYYLTAYKKQAKEITMLQQYLNKHYKEKIAIDDLANMVSMNKYALLHKYKQDCGHTIYEELIQLRLSHACRLLKTTAQTIETIALESGFSSSAYFIQRFHKQYHITPLQYRKTYQKQAID